MTRARLLALGGCAAIACAAPKATTGVAGPDAGDAAGTSAADDGGIASDSGISSDDGGNATDDAGVSGDDAGSAADAGDDGGVGPTGATGPTGYPWTVGPPTPPAEWLDTDPACSPTDWLAKYFHYRTRFRGDGTATNPGFVSIGPDTGQSIPPSWRTPDTDCSNDWSVQGCNVQPLPPNTLGALKWGDGTVWLGWYLATLGSEEAAFKALGVPTTETESDLFYALSAFDRLDRTAETYLGYPANLDGFFMRDDVPSGFVWADAAHTKMRYPRSDNGLVGYSCVSTEANCGTITVKDGYFISQDQIIEMMPGLALVSRMVPPGTVVQGMDLAQHAKEIVDRVVMYLKRNNWKIVGPDGTSPPNQWGGTALPYSNQIAKCANFITGNQLGTSDYRDLLSETAGAALTGAVDAAWDVQTLNNQSMVLALETVSDGWTVDKLVSRATDWDAPVFPMMNALLYGRGMPPGIDDNVVEAMLTTAPCGGPCYGTPGCVAVPGWSGEHRFKSPESRDGDVYDRTGEFTGLDYMLLHNLYVALKHGKYEVASGTAPVCRGETPLTEWTEVAPPRVGDTYDPWSSCNWRDFQTPFCGRPWVTWLDAAYRGDAHLFFPGVQLQCNGLAPCTFIASSDVGTEGPDLFLGGPGNDRFDAAGGGDCLYGFGGDDYLEGGQGMDELHGGPGNDKLCGEHCDVTELFGAPDVIYGDEGDDEIQGGPGADSLHGGPGNDVIYGDLGRDRIFGDEGDDELHGGFGDDYLRGGPGNDTIYGDEGDDKLYGDDGRDKLNGGPGNDILHGGAGDDFLMGGGGDDTLYGDDGDDRLCGGCGTDTLYGGPGNDSCRGETAEPPIFCIGEHGDQSFECESHASADDCLDPAFDAW